MAKTTDYGQFTKKNPVTGKEMQRVADSPQDAVRLKFDGWVEQTEAASKTARSAPASTGTKPASTSNS